MNISVVIPSYNEEKYLPLCLKSLLNQDFKGTYEVIVVNNASNDKTNSIVKKFNVKSVYVKKKGVSMARHAGFKKANGEIIVSTDADTIVPENWLSEIYKRFKEDKELVGISGAVSFWDGGFIDNLFVLPHIGYKYLNYFLKIGFFAGCNMAIRKKVFEEIGGFDLNKVSAEDLDICLKLQKRGKIKFTPKVRVKTSARKLREQGYFKFGYYNIYNQLRVGLLKISPLPMEDIREMEPKLKKKFNSLAAIYTYLATTEIPNDYIKKKINKKINKKIFGKISNNINVAVSKVRDFDIMNYLS